MVATHGQRISRGAQQACVGNRDECQQCSNRQNNNPRKTHSVTGRGRDRGKVVVQFFRRNQANDYRGTEAIYQNSAGEGKEHRSRQGSFRILDLFRQARNLGHTDVTDINQARCRNDIVETSCQETSEMSRLHRERAAGNKNQQQAEEAENQSDLKTSALFGTQQIDQSKQNSNRNGNGDNLYLREVQSNIGAHADQSEGDFKDQSQPSTNSADRAKEWPEGAIQKIVDPSGTRHSCRQFYHTERGRDHRQSRQHIRENKGRTSFDGSNAGQQKKAGSQSCPGCDSIDIKQTELFFQTYVFIDKSHFDSRSSGSLYKSVRSPVINPSKGAKYIITIQMSDKTIAATKRLLPKKACRNF